MSAETFADELQRILQRTDAVLHIERLPGDYHVYRIVFLASKIRGKPERPRCLSKPQTATV